ncbi:hypothetical protein JTB14_027580 [Gonioctena quinquepunctata]|nr:hypothetical protein JTB14_027580 [Gonioctena quinquepunctata]
MKKMMSRKISGSILENLNCDSCHKSLSVLLVEVYSNGKKKCRRCPIKREKLVFVKLNSVGYSLSFNDWYLENNNGVEKITQKSILYHGNDDSSTDMRLCHPSTDINDVGFITSGTSLNKFESLVVSFQLKVTRTMLSDSHFLAKLQSCPGSAQ